MKNLKQLMGNTVLLVLVLTLIITMSTGCNKKIEASEYNKTLVLTVDGTKIYLDEMMYHVMITKLQGNLYASFLNEEDFWNKDYEDGVTMEEVMKDETIDNAIKYELLYEKAKNENYKLSEEDMESCNEKVESILKSVPSEEIESMQLTKDKLLEIQKKIALSTQYYEENYINKGINDETAFQEMKKGHKIVVEDEVWKQVKLSE